MLRNGSFCYLLHLFVFIEIVCYANEIKRKHLITIFDSFHSQNIILYSFHIFRFECNCERDRPTKMAVITNKFEY